MTLDTSTEMLGLLGVCLYLGAYLALQAGFLRSTTFSYSALNLAAAAAVLYALQAQATLPAQLMHVGWIAISLYGIVRLVMMARHVGFTADEAKLIASKLPGLSRTSARRFLDAGRWSEAPAGFELARERVPVHHLIYILEGSAEVSQDGHRLASCPGDSFVGELTALDGLPATATVTLAERSRYFTIEASDLRRLAERDPELNRALHSSFTGDARRKLVAANERQRQLELGIPAT